MERLTEFVKLPSAIFGSVAFSESGVVVERRIHRRSLARLRLSAF